MNKAILFVSACGLFAAPAFADADVKQMSCAAEPILRSTAAVKSTAIIFFNDNSAARDVYWLDYSGKRVFYARLQPRQRYEQPTFVTHPWVIATPPGESGGGRCLAIYLPADTPRLVIIP